MEARREVGDLILPCARPGFGPPFVTFGGRSSDLPSRPSARPSVAMGQASLREGRKEEGRQAPIYFLFSLSTGMAHGICVDSCLLMFRGACGGRLHLQPVGQDAACCTLAWRA
eukprot:941628-Prymnesium_polylepis.1